MTHVLMLAMALLLVQLPTRDMARGPQSGTARIRGSVVEAQGNTALRRARVSLTAVDIPQFRRETATDADGRYEFVDLPAGRYHATVTKAGYVTMQYGQRRPFEPGTSISVGEGETLSSVNFALPKGAAITVRLTDAFGEPVTGHVVTVQRFQWNEDGQLHLTRALGGLPFETDDLGEARIYGLMPGEYVIEAEPAARTRFANADSAEGFGRTFYPGTLSATDAQRISVGFGDEVSLHFPLVASRLSRISGTAADAQGRPAVGATMVLVTPLGCGEFSSGLGAGQVGPDGRFAVSGVPPGEHYLQFRMRDGADTLSASVPITVAGDINGMAAVLGSGATLTGRVLYDGTPDGPGWPGRLRVVAREVCQLRDGTGPSGGAVDSDDSFRITGAAGRLFLTVPELPPTWMIKSVTLDGIDITVTPLDVSDRRTISDIHVTLTEHINTIDGFVTDARGQNVRAYVVVIQSADQLTPQVAGRLIKVARPDTNGRFEVRGLRPGRYLATAIEWMEQNRQYSPEFQNRLRRGAREFTVRERETTRLDLRLAPDL